MIKQLILLGLGASVFASEIINSGCEELAVQHADRMLKSTASKQDIMNLDSAFEHHMNINDLVKAARGKDKDKKKDKKSKKERRDRSSSSDDDRRSRHSVPRKPLLQPVVADPEPVMRQQEAVAIDRNDRRSGRYVSREEDDVGIINSGVRGEDGIITVTGPIRRKPLIHK